MENKKWREEVLQKVVDTDNVAQTVASIEAMGADVTYWHLRDDLRTLELEITVKLPALT